jgi:hypothetical protein
VVAAGEAEASPARGLGGGEGGGEGLIVRIGCTVDHPLMVLPKIFSRNGVLSPAQWLIEI